jgi:hypothetical protein
MEHNSAVKARNITSFVVGVATGTLLDVGHQNKEDVQRIVRSDGSASSWKEYDPGR